jgi:hypothetical protein
MGMRCSDVCPGTSNITESHDAETTFAAYRLRHWPRNHARVSSGGVVTAACASAALTNSVT